MKDRERDQEANVVDTAVQVLGTVAGQLGWPQYQELLGIFNRAMQRTEGKVRAANVHVATRKQLCCCVRNVERATTKDGVAESPGHQF